MGLRPQHGAPVPRVWVRGNSCSAGEPGGGAGISASPIDLRGGKQMSSDDDDAPWYRQRTYAHFDRRPSRDRVLAYVRDPDRVARHGFFPFIMRPVRVCHFKADGAGRRRHVYKVRPVTYAAHLDTQIHAYYAYDLNQRLEVRLQDAYGRSVLAYRQHHPPRSNIDFALEAFSEVIERGEADVLALDVEGFFDGLNHELLKAAWADLLGVDRLPPDHFAVFRSVTRDHAIEWPELRRVLGEKYRRRAGATGEPICTLADFRQKIAPLAEPRHSLVWKVKGKPPPPCIPIGVPVGIPQGSAISAVLANLYMRNVDEQLFSALGAKGASYRRYSDDILVICPPGDLKVVEAIVKGALAGVKLAVNDKKTERVEFRLSAGKLSSTYITPAGDQHPGRPMQYLGLTFNGEKARLRDGTISRYLIRMNRAVMRGRYAAENDEPARIKRRKIYATMSRLGVGQAYGPWKLEDGRWLPPDCAPRPGFLNYATRAHSKADARSGIEKQNLRAWEKLHQALRKEQGKVKKKT